MYIKLYFQKGEKMNIIRKAKRVSKWRIYVEMNVKQNRCEISISDETFIFPIVNGMGKMIDELIPGKEYRLIKRKGYYVVLDKRKKRLQSPYLPITK